MRRPRRSRRGSLAAGLVAVALALSPVPEGLAWSAGFADRQPAPQEPSPERVGEASPERAGPPGAPTDAELDALTARVADQLRCPVCRNQSVLESSSELARRMQTVIRERLAAGESPEAVKVYFVERYGEWILLKPEARGINWIVYLLPAGLVLGGILFLRERLRAWLGARSSGAGDDAPVVAGETSGGTSPAKRRSAVATGLTEREEAWLDEAIRSR